ncbi:MAG: amino acid ABC transporter ATP-binding protein [Alphaproteobacteria bacterium]|nr:MAG: amino acid ABC transporter ATP-binding protein [Alphaproteobacteria bacterium]
MFIAKNISKSLQGFPVVQDVSLTVAPGTITAIVGPSGGGKTTLLRSLSMIETPDSGSISIDGREYHFPMAEGAQFTPPWPEMTVVFQQLFLWPHITLRQNLLLPIEDKLTPERKELVEEVIDFFGMRQFIDRYPSEVSGGQKQRLALARAIALQPKYLLLDEITSALDVEQIAKILEFLLVVKDKGCGMIIVTHHLNFAKRAANQIICLDQGRAIEQGGSEILENPQNPRIKTFLSHVLAAS